MKFETLIVDIDDHIATVTINRPEAMNSFTRQMMDECQTVWRHIAETADIHCAVLRAAPGRAFSTGVDVKATQAPGGSVMHEDIWTAEDPGDKLGPKSNGCWKPVICAVHGMAAGGAFYWINEADILICSEDATFFDPHVTYGGRHRKGHLGIPGPASLSRPENGAEILPDRQSCGNGADRSNKDHGRQKQEIQRTLNQAAWMKTETSQ